MLFRYYKLNFNQLSDITKAYGVFDSFIEINEEKELIPYEK